MRVEGVERKHKETFSLQAAELGVVAARQSLGLSKTRAV